MKPHNRVAIISFAIALSLLTCFDAEASYLRFAFTNQFNQPDTNYIKVQQVSPVVNSDGSVITIGLPIRWNMPTNGILITNMLAPGNWQVTNSYLGRGVVFRAIYDSSSTVWDAMAGPPFGLGISGFNTFNVGFFTADALAYISTNYFNGNLNSASNFLYGFALTNIVPVSAGTSNRWRIDATNTSAYFGGLSTNFTIAVSNWALNLIASSTNAGATTNYVNSAIQFATNTLGTNILARGYATTNYVNSATNAIWILSSNYTTTASNSLYLAKLASTNGIDSAAYKPISFFQRSSVTLSNLASTGAITNILAGSNATVQIANGIATVNAIPGSGGQSNSVSAGSRITVVTNGNNYAVTAVSQTNGIQPAAYQSSFQPPSANLTNWSSTSVFSTNGLATTNFAKLMTNVISGPAVAGAVSQSTHATNADLATLATTATLSTQTHGFDLTATGIMIDTSEAIFSARILNANDYIGTLTGNATTATTADTATTATTANTVSSGITNAFLSFIASSNNATRIIATNLTISKVNSTNGHAYNLTLDTNVFFGGSNPTIKIFTNYIGISGSTMPKVNGTYQYETGMTLTNIADNSYRLWLNGGNWYIQSNAVSLYALSGTYPVGTGWTLVNGVNPTPISFYGWQIDWTGSVGIGPMNSTNLSYQIINSIGNYAVTNGDTRALTFPNTNNVFYGTLVGAATTSSTNAQYLGGTYYTAYLKTNSTVRLIQLETNGGQSGWVIGWNTNGGTWLTNSGAGGSFSGTATNLDGNATNQVNNIAFYYADRSTNGLGSAAWKNISFFDASGTAVTAATAATNNSLIISSNYTTIISNFLFGRIVAASNNSLTISSNFSYYIGLNGSNNVLAVSNYLYGQISSGGGGSSNAINSLNGFGTNTTLINIKGFTNQANLNIVASNIFLYPIQPCDLVSSPGGMNTTMPFVPPWTATNINNIITNFFDGSTYSGGGFANLPTYTLIVTNTCSGPTFFTMSGNITVAHDTGGTLIANDIWRLTVGSTIVFGITNASVSHQPISYSQFMNSGDAVTITISSSLAYTGISTPDHFSFVGNITNSFVGTNGMGGVSIGTNSPGTNMLEVFGNVDALSYTMNGVPLSSFTNISTGTGPLVRSNSPSINAANFSGTNTATTINATTLVVGSGGISGNANGLTNISASGLVVSNALLTVVTNSYQLYYTNDLLTILITGSESNSVNGTYIQKSTGAATIWTNTAIPSIVLSSNLDGANPNFSEISNNAALLFYFAGGVVGNYTEATGGDSGTMVAYKSNPANTNGVTELQIPALVKPYGYPGITWVDKAYGSDASGRIGYSAFSGVNWAATQTPSNGTIVIVGQTNVGGATTKDGMSVIGLGRVKMGTAISLTNNVYMANVQIVNSAIAVDNLVAPSKNITLNNIEAGGNSVIDGFYSAGAVSNLLCMDCYFHSSFDSVVTFGTTYAKFLNCRIESIYNTNNPGASAPVHGVSINNAGSYQFFGGSITSSNGLDTNTACIFVDGAVSPVIELYGTALNYGNTNGGLTSYPFKFVHGATPIIRGYWIQNGILVGNGAGLSNVTSTASLTNLTPWTTDINAATHWLTNLGDIEMSGSVSSATNSSGYSQFLLSDDSLEADGTYAQMIRFANNYGTTNAGVMFLHTINHPIVFSSSTNGSLNYSWDMIVSNKSVRVPGRLQAGTFIGDGASDGTGSIVSSNAPTINNATFIGTSSFATLVVSGTLSASNLVGSSKGLTNDQRVVDLASTNSLASVSNVVQLIASSGALNQTNLYAYQTNTLVGLLTYTARTNTVIVNNGEALIVLTNTGTIGTLTFVDRKLFLTVSNGTATATNFYFTAAATAVGQVTTNIFTSGTVSIPAGKELYLDIWNPASPKYAGFIQP